MLSLLRFPALAKVALGGAAGSMLLAGALVASPSVLAAAPGSTPSPTATTAPSKHHKGDHHSDRKVKIEAYLDASATIMKMDPKDLRAALKSGRSMEAIAAEHGFATKAAFAEADSKAVKPALDAAVDAKKLTRAEADRFQVRLAHGHLPYWVRHHKK